MAACVAAKSRDTNKSILVLSVLWQLAAILPISVVLAIVSKPMAFSALIGALIFIVSNGYFTLYAFRYRFNGVDNRSASWVARSFARGEMGKLALAAVGFALALCFYTFSHIPALYGGFCLMLVCQWFIAHYIAKRCEFWVTAK